MSIDLNEPEVRDAIKTAIEEAVSGLKAKNGELLTEVKKLRKGQEVDPEDFNRLKEEYEALTDQLSEAQKAVKVSAKTLETVQAQLNAETGFTSKLLVDNGLTDALVKNGIAPQYLNAAKSMFTSQAQIVADGDNRTAKIGDKALTDFVKEWSLGEEGKHFIAAPANNGGGSPGGKGSNNSAKVLPRAGFEALDASARMEFSRAGGTLTD